MLPTSFTFPASPSSDLQQPIPSVHAYLPIVSAGWLSSLALGAGSFARGVCDRALPSSFIAGKSHLCQLPALWNSPPMAPILRKTSSAVESVSVLTVFCSLSVDGNCWWLAPSTFLCDAPSPDARAVRHPLSACSLWMCPRGFAPERLFQRSYSE